MGTQGIQMISDTFATSPQSLAKYPASERVKQIMKKSMVIDSLFSAVWPMQWTNEDQFHPTMDECMAAGMKVLGYCPSADAASNTFAQAIEQLQFPLRKINERPDKYKIVRTAKDIRDAVAEGKLGIYFTHQGTNQFEGDVERVGVMRQLGYGYCLLAYNVRNAVGDGCAEDDNAGLTAYGRKLISAYNRYGMVVDVSHTGDRTAREACEHSTQPVIASHSGAHKVAPMYRNLSDELIKAIAATSGVCGIVTTGAFADLTNPEVVSPDALFRHIDHMVQLLGNTDHVGYGSDYIPDTTATCKLALAKPGIYPDKGVEPGYTLQALQMFIPTPHPARMMPAVVDTMLGHGYSEEDCGKILGGNLLRLFEQVWR